MSGLRRTVRLHQNNVGGPVLVMSCAPPARIMQLTRCTIARSIMSTNCNHRLDRTTLTTNIRLTMRVGISANVSHINFIYRTLASTPSMTSSVTEIYHLPNLETRNVFARFMSTSRRRSSNFATRRFTVFRTIVNTLNSGKITFALHRYYGDTTALQFPTCRLSVMHPNIIICKLVPSS